MKNKKFEVLPGYHEYNVYLNDKLIYCAGDLTPDADDPFPFRKQDARTYSDIMAEIVLEFQNDEYDFENKKKSIEDLERVILSDKDLKALSKAFYEGCYSRYID